jgi:hypothetical protein
MIFVLFRVLAFVGVAALLFFIIQWMVSPSGSPRCVRCEGKGFWYGARGKETCDWCKGSGKLPTNLN